MSIKVQEWNVKLLRDAARDLNGTTVLYRTPPEVSSWHCGLRRDIQFVDRSNGPAISDSAGTQQESCVVINIESPPASDLFVLGGHAKRGKES